VWSTVREKTKQFIRLARSVAQSIKGAQISLYAAQAAYFALFSAIPMLILLFAVLGMLVDGMPQKIAEVLCRYYPDAGSVITEGAVARFLDAGAMAVPTSALVILWSASRGVRAIGEGISGIYGSLFGQKNLLWRYAYSLLYTLILLAALILSFGTVAFGKRAALLLGRLFPKGLAVFSSLVGWRWLIASVLLTAFFALLYRLMGGREVPFSRHLPGALFAGVGWVIYSLLFSLYLRCFSNWHSIYGSLSVLLILMLWMYGCMYMLMLGALLNTYCLRRACIIR